MKALIQHNWTSGLGDLYCAICEYLDYTEKLKEIGYEVELFFAFTKFNKYITPVELDLIFNMETFKIFDKVTVSEYPINVEEYNEYRFHSSVYGSKTPGNHWWDVFYDNAPNNTIDKISVNPTTILRHENEIKNKPIFNDEIYRRVLNFKEKINKEYDFIHIRYFDYKNYGIEDWFKIMVDELHDNIKKSDKYFHIGSNSPYLNEKLHNLDNVIQYGFNNLDILTNDHFYGQLNKNRKEITTEILLDRLYDNLAEMISIENAKRIHGYTSYGWTSNFLSHGLISGKNYIPISHKNISNIIK